MVCVDKQHILSQRIPILLSVCQLLVQPTQRMQEILLLHERQQNHRLPQHHLAIAVQLEVGGVEVEDRRLLHHLVLIRNTHDVTVGFRNTLCGGGREDTHKLLEGFERASLREGWVDLSEVVGDVGGEGSVVVGIVPFPRTASLVVVAEDPREALDV